MNGHTIPAVLHISQKDLSERKGETAHIIELARALCAEGTEVEVVVPSAGRYPDAVPFRIRYLPAFRRPRLARLLSFELSLAVFFLTRPLLTRRVQLYVRKGVFLHTALAAARLMGRPAIVEVNGRDEEAAQFHELSPRVVPLLHLLTRAAFKMAGAIITVSEDLRVWIVSLGIEPAKVAVVANGADPDRFRPMNRSECCRTLGLEERFRWLCFVGAMEFWQGLESLLEAMAIVAREKEEARLLLAGPGKERGKLELLASELGIRDRVVFAGPVPHTQVPVYIGASDICLAPVAAAEHCPIKVFEYLACERPVVASDISAVAEVLAPSLLGLGASGWLARAGCSEDLAAKILQALDTGEAERSEMGRRGRRLVVERYSWSSVARRVLDVAANVSARHLLYAAKGLDDWERKGVES